MKCYILKTPTGRAETPSRQMGRQSWWPPGRPLSPGLRLSPLYNSLSLILSGKAPLLQFFSHENQTLIGICRSDLAPILRLLKLKPRGTWGHFLRPWQVYLAVLFSFFFLSITFHREAACLFLPSGN